MDKGSKLDIKARRLFSSTRTNLNGKTFLYGAIVIGILLVSFSVFYSMVIRPITQKSEFDQCVEEGLERWPLLDASYDCNIKVYGNPQFVR